MKKLSLIASSVTLMALPMLTSAQGLADGADAGPLQDLLSNILGFTNSTLIPFILAIGFLVFVFGMFRYFIAGGANEEARDSGKSLMIYATLGFVLIIVFWGVINLLSAATGLEGEQIKNTPKVENPIP